MNYLILITIFIAVTSISFVFAKRLEANKRVAKRLNQVSDSSLLQQNLWQNMIDWCNRVVARVIPPKCLFFLEEKLVVAGNPLGLHAGSFIVLQLVNIGVAVALYLLIRVSALNSNTKSWASILVISCCLLAPYLLLSRKAKLRQKEIEKGLPDFLDRLDIAINVGLSFNTGVERVLLHMKESALKGEFSRALREIKYGKSFEEALTGVANRVKLPDATFFVNTVNHAHRMGVDISEVIREQAKDIRVRHRQKSEEAAAKASTKLIFPLVICVLPILLILLVGPLIIRVIANLAAIG